jgi:hypothetical protein
VNGLHIRMGANAPSATDLNRKYCQLVQIPLSLAARPDIGTGANSLASRASGYQSRIDLKPDRAEEPGDRASPLEVNQCVDNLADLE